MGKRSTRPYVVAASSLLATLLATAVSAAEPTAEGLEFFESRIRPVLVEQCYSCHNSTETAEGGLAVDHRAALLKGGENGKFVVPGDAKKSRLLPILRHEVNGLEMPQDGPKLARSVVRDFEKWIAMGAPDPRDQPPSAEDVARATSWEATRERRKRWWSFQPIGSPEAPDVEGIQHPIDRFVRARLERAELEPGELADPSTLVRRLHFALIGLPPSPEEVELWTQRLAVDDVDERDAAYAELVDALLASPHFGERWARHWMDWIRYAETHGSEGDPAIDGAWRYRDYLIRAFNADVPYDQLVREHVAGDLLEQPRINAELGINESLIGTAHWRMVFHGFAPTDALDERVRFTDDQINAFSKAFLGLTVACARCHDHKFDAISQKDYYALFGVLRSCRPGREAIETVERQRTNHDELARLKPRIRTALADAWLATLPDLRERLLDADGPVAGAKDANHPLHPLFGMRTVPAERFAEAWRGQVAKWNTARQGDEKTPESLRRWRLGDPEVHAEWMRTGVGLPAEPHSAGTFVVAPTGERIVQGVYPAGIYSHTLSAKHAARLTSPDVPLDGEYELWIHCAGGEGATVRYAVHDYPRRGTVYPVAQLGDWRWQRFDLAYWNGEEIHVELTTAADAPLLTKGNPRSWFGVREVIVRRKGDGAPQQEREFLAPLLEATKNSSPKSYADLVDAWIDGALSSIDAWRDGKATDADATLLAACLEHGLLANELAALPNVAPLVERYRELEAEIPVPTRVPALQETPGRDQPLFVRGNHRTPGEIVPRRFLEAIDETPYGGAGSGRRQLAEDLLREDNPFTRRVIVNRLWHHLFGAGIVRTPDNLGRLGEPPTHPELLDWLANRFVEDEWSLKRTIRLIVTSRTWQQSSRPSARAVEVDPDNRLLSHANVRRLEAEAIRDTLLAVSGTLDRRPFGPPVDGNAPRRSVYVRVARNRLDPFLRAFDFPEPFSSVGRRDVTNVPAQSLVWMNDARVHALAANWAERVRADELLTSDRERVQAMWTAAFGRPATVNEAKGMLAFLETSRNSYKDRYDEAEDIRAFIGSLRSRRARLFAPVRERVRAARDEKDAEKPEPPQPIARWEFDDHAGDAVGKLHLELKGGARVEGGALVLDGRRAYAVTELVDVELREKTLEAWVRLDSLSQRGGGVLSVQTPDGAVFDSIVFGEQKPGEWLAGSDFFRRTKSFGGSKETETKAAVHVAVVYHADGRVVGYRNGRPYGKPYKSNGPVLFEKGAAIVSLGVRHLPATGNRLLAGRIERAQLHARALTAEEVAASASVTSIVTDEEVIAALSPDERKRHDQLVEAIAGMAGRIEKLEPLSSWSEVERQPWTDLALAMFGAKEFLYLR